MAAKTLDCKEYFKYINMLIIYIYIYDQNNVCWSNKLGLIVVFSGVCEL